MIPADVYSKDSCLDWKTVVLEDHKKVTKYIKSLRRKDLSPERCFSLVRLHRGAQGQVFFADARS